MDDQTKHSKHSKTRINNRPRKKGGVFREMINIELTLETRKAFIQTLKEWLLGKKQPLFEFATLAHIVGDVVTSPLTNLRLVTTLQAYHQL